MSRTCLMVIDVGNTNVSLGIFDYRDGQSVLAHHWRIGTHREQTSDEVAIAVEALFRQGDRTIDEVLTALDEAKVPAAPVYTPQQALDDDHIEAIGFLQPTDYPGGLDKPAPLASFPVAMTGVDTSIRHPAPMLGEHTDEILAEAGYSSVDVEAYRTAGFVA